MAMVGSETAAFEDQSLPELFDRGQRIWQDVEGETSGSLQPLERNINFGTAILRRADQLLSVLGIFSTNEAKDDLSTQSLKYLLIPYYMANLLSRTTARDVDQRQITLREALKYYTSFLESCEQYSLLGPEARGLVAAGEGGSHRPSREQKIAQYKRWGPGVTSRCSGQPEGRAGCRRSPGMWCAVQREKALRERLREVQDHRIHSRRRQLADTLDEEPWSGGVDEDVEREFWCLQIELDGVRATQQVRCIQEELELLKHAASLPPGPAASLGRPPPPPAALQELHQVSSALGNKRAELQQRVFQPSHVLPTRSLKEEVGLIVASGRPAKDRSARSMPTAVMRPRSFTRRRWVCAAGGEGDGSRSGFGQSGKEHVREEERRRG
jgi:immunoglobulin-binding protein 1